MFFMKKRTVSTIFWKYSGLARFVLLQTKNERAQHEKYEAPKITGH